MVTYIFNGECQQSIKQAFIDTYLPKLELVVETTADYKKSGIYSAERNYASVPIVIDWGDGTVERVDGDISQKVHEYATVGTFNVVVKNIKSYAASANNSTWYKTTSQNAYTLKEVITIPDSVTSIGSYAFQSCDKLTSVAMPDSVTSIGYMAFYNCRGLTSVTIPDGVTRIGDSAFSGCNGLTSVTIPNSVTSIGYRAFYACGGLTSVTIPDSVTSIGEGAFSNCSGLMLFTVGDGNVNYKSVNGLLLSKDGKTLIASINDNVTIPNSVTIIGNSAFRSCNRLTGVTIPDSVTSIGSYAFLSCRKLTSVTIGNGVTSIGYQAFDGCSGLTSVHITDLAKWCSISFLDGFANPLYYAHNLYLNGEKVADLMIPDGVTSIRARAFSDCTGLTSVTLGNSVTNIGDQAFYNCSSLTSMTIGSGVTSIGELAFMGCSGLTSVAIPNNVTSIRTRAFQQCSGLTSVTIGSGVTSIGSSAFYQCSGLTSVTFEGKTLADVQAMNSYPWGITDTSIITVI